MVLPNGDAALVTTLNAFPGVPLNAIANGLGAYGGVQVGTAFGVESWDDVRGPAVNISAGGGDGYGGGVDVSVGASGSGLITVTGPFGGGAESFGGLITNTWVDPFCK
jgi:hypothetical protein